MEPSAGLDVERGRVIAAFSIMTRIRGDLMHEPDAAQFGADSVGLFLDVDGTIVDFAPTPNSVRVSDGLIDSLASLDESLGGALAFVSGRPIEQLDALFAPLKLRASGVHGGRDSVRAGGP